MPFKTQRRVEWHNTDAAGIMHFAAFFEMMEEAEHELLRSLGLSVLMQLDGQRISFPRVAAKCEFQCSLQFGDVVDIHVLVKRLGKKSITYDFQFFQQDQEVAQGTITAVCCRIDDHPPESIRIPAKIRESLQQYHKK